MEKNKKIIIAGGGTGGHVYPAIAIAEAIKEISPKTEILFVGAENKLETIKVPQAGFQIIALPVSGLQRKFTLKNIKTIFNFLKSIKKAKQIIKEFKPDAIVGVGGYASAPILYVASKTKDICITLQEQNSYPGMTNRFFAKYAKYIFLGFKDAENYFQTKENLIFSGNPIRNLNKNLPEKTEIYKHFGLNPNLPTILLTGGSLGAKTLNKAVLKNLEKIKNASVQLIWQCGKYYYEDLKKQTENLLNEKIKLLPFIEKMNYAMEIADLVISRAGGITITELAVKGKPVILVPSPNVAENHQYKNAMSLVRNNAALLVEDSQAEDKLFDLALKTINDKELLETLSKNILKQANPSAAKNIAQTILKNC